LVLVAAPTRLFARQSGDWSVRYELLSVSACDERDGLDALRRSAHCGETRDGRPVAVIDDHTLRF
jgi:hypothetical protein